MSTKVIIAWLGEFIRAHLESGATSDHFLVHVFYSHNKYKLSWHKISQWDSAVLEDSLPNDYAFELYDEPRSRPPSRKSTKTIMQRKTPSGKPKVGEQTGVLRSRSNSTSSCQKHSRYQNFGSTCPGSAQPLVALWYNPR